jgi:hypothetical protein
MSGAKRRLAGATGAAFALLLSVGATSGCGGRPQTVAVPVEVPVAVPGVTYEQEFVDQARYQGDFSAMYDADILATGYQVCTDLGLRPDYVFDDYYPYFIDLAVQYLCPEHEQTLYYLTH